MAFKQIIETETGYKLVNAIPQFGVNYNVGYIGFSNNDSRIAKLIKWGTKYDKKEKIEATHALIIISETECIEALMGKGVVISPLAKYFDSNEFDIIIRAPKEYNLELGNEIVSIANKQLGSPYSAKAIVNSFLRGLFVGHIIDKITNNKLWDFLCVNRVGKQTFICSALVAYCLQNLQNWTFKRTGVLKRNFSGINPVELLYENNIFEDYANNKIVV